MKRALGIAKLLLLTLTGLAVFWALAVVAVLVLPSSWTSRRPPDAELLQRHLGLESTNGFSRIEVKYQPAREWTAWFYLEAEPERIERLLRERQFNEEERRKAAESVRALRMKSFSTAPPPPTNGVRMYFKWSPSEGASYRAVTGTNGSQIWITVHRS